MLTKSSVSIALVLSGALLLHSSARATTVYEAEVKSRYFRVVDNRSEADEIAVAWRWWLQAHRAIRANPQLARKLAASPPDLREAQDKAGEWLVFKSEEEQAARLGLTPAQVNAQPTTLYTLQVASFRSAANLQTFVKRHWSSRHLNWLSIYARTPKSFALFASAEATTKPDPLYITRVKLRGQEATRLCYGLYENRADAQADQKVLQRHLGRPVQIVSTPFTTSLVEKVLFDPVEGKELDDWEIEEPDDAP